MVVSLAVIVLAGSMALAAGAPESGTEPNAPEYVRVQGQVQVVKDANDIVVEVKIAAKDTVYNVVLNEKAKEMASTMENKEVSVRATLTEKEGQKWLEILSYRPVPEKPKS
jgi:hypothetical protein